MNANDYGLLHAGTPNIMREHLRGAITTKASQEWEARIMPAASTVAATASMHRHHLLRRWWRWATRPVTRPTETCAAC
jgi:hypothetical protein